MQMHYVVMAASADTRGWRFLVGIDDARRPIWGESAKAVHFPTFQQARRVARRVGDAEICASLTTQEANR